MSDIVRMECGDELRFDVATPRIDDYIWCRYHHDMMKVVVSPLSLQQFRGKCKRCVYGYRSRDIGLVIRAVKKHVRTQGHEVQIFDAQNVRKVLITASLRNITGLEQLEIFENLVDTTADTG